MSNCFIVNLLKLWISLVGFIIGFGMYGAITLFGVMAMEVSPPKLEGTSHSMVTLGSNRELIFILMWNGLSLKVCYLRTQFGFLFVGNIIFFFMIMNLFLGSNAVEEVVSVGMD